MSDAGIEEGETFAKAQDAADPLARFREHFHIPLGEDGRPVAYFCGNSLGLQPRAARQRVLDELDDWARLGVLGHLEARTPWFSYHEIFREPGARLVGARPGEVVMMGSLTQNLHLMLASFYRPTAARHRVVIEAGAFPSDRYAVASHVLHRGFDPASAVVELSPSDPRAGLQPSDLAAYLEREGNSVALVVLGGVHYYTGQLLDMPGFVREAHAHGALCGFDLAHAAGNCAMALHDWQVDFAVWCSYKYLNSGPGAVAGCFVHERHGNDPSTPRLSGWWGNDPASRFGMPRDFAPQPGAAGWQLSNPPILSLAPLAASLELFDAAGMPALCAKAQRLTAYLERSLALLGGGRFEIITPPPPARGCQLSVRVPRGAKAVAAALEARGVIADFRAPDVIRAAPVPLYNTFHDVWRFAQAFLGALDAVA